MQGTTYSVTLHFRSDDCWEVSWEMYLLVTLVNTIFITKNVDGVSNVRVTFHAEFKNAIRNFLSLMTFAKPCVIEKN